MTLAAQSIKVLIMKNKYMVIVINSAGDYIAHPRYDTKEEAQKSMKIWPSYFIVELYELVESN